MKGSGHDDMAAPFRLHTRLCVLRTLKFLLLFRQRFHLVPLQQQIESCRVQCEALGILNQRQNQLLERRSQRLQLPGILLAEFFKLPQV